MFFMLENSISYGKYVIDNNIIAMELNIDRTKPVGKVKYSTSDMTKEDVVVTVELSEPIENINGWEFSENKLTMTKVYNQNIIEELTIADLSGNENTIEIKIQNIDREKPIISLLNVYNNNEGYEGYASNIHNIRSTIKITDKQIKNSVDISQINVLVGANLNTCKKKLQNISQTETEIIFDLELTEVQENGELQLVLPEGFITDAAGNSSAGEIYNLNIIIDNIAPQGQLSQLILENGKIEGRIDTNEKIRDIYDWSNSENTTFKKIFPANVTYIVEITDYAQNEASVEVNITNASYISLTYAAHNSEIGWTYGHGNYDIAGEKTTAGRNLQMPAIRAAIIPKSKAEGLIKLWNKDIGTSNIN